MKCFVFFGICGSISKMLSTLSNNIGKWEKEHMGRENSEFYRNDRRQPNYYPKRKSRIQGKTLAAGLILGIIIGFPMGYFMTQLPLAQQYTNDNTPTPQATIQPDRITIPGGQTVSKTFNQKVYSFTYVQKGTLGAEIPYFIVTRDTASLVPMTHDAVQGSHYGVSLYEDQSLNVVVLEVRSDYLVLQIVPTLIMRIP